MTTQVQITKFISSGNWIINAVVLSPADIPLDVFLYENTGTTELGGYFGVANMQDYTRIQSWAGDVIPVFGNKYVKHSVANIILPVELNANSVIENIKSSITRFKAEYLTGASETNIYTL